MSALTFGSLFSGIGGLDLGLERAGMVCRWQVEIDDYCRRVLTKHWPDVPKYGDIRKVSGRELEYVDVICGGFPCQDISDAGNKSGIDGLRSGLWAEFARIIRVVGPQYVLVENVSALLHRGMGRVLGDLAVCGYDAEWQCISAAAVGAPHLRDRVWILAYATRRSGVLLHRAPGDDGGAWPRVAGDVADSSSESRGALGYGFRHWLREPDICRVAYGIPAPVDRLRGLGNAVVPQVAEWIGRRIVEAS